MKNIDKIEDLFEEINETMTKEYGKNEKITNKWKEVNDLEEMLNLDVDIVHGPLRETDLLEVENVVELYAA